MPQYELNINDYLRILRKRKLVIIFCFVTTIAGSMAYLSKQIPVYRARTTVKIEERKTIAGLLTEWILSNPADMMQSEASIIRGFPIVEKVALRLGRIDAHTPSDKVHAAVAELQGSISTETIKQTNLIEIVVTGGDPRTVAEVANTVAQVYVEENLANKAKQARTVRQFIEEQLTSIEARLRTTEERLRVFGDEVKDIRMSSPIQEKLMSLEFELVSLLQKYTDKHPQVRQLKEQIKELEAQIQGFSGKELEYSRLTREVEVNKKLYGMLKEKLEEARITEAQKVPDVSVVDPAVIPASPVGADNRMKVMVGALMGLTIGVILAFIIESVDTSIGTIEDVETLTKLPVLGVVSSAAAEYKQKSLHRKIYAHFFPFKRSKNQETYIRLLVHHLPKSPIAESYRAIRTSLKLETKPAAFLVTSASPREGKTTILTNLGLAVAQTGAKTLLVSSDLRRPAIAKNFGMNEEPGLNEVLTKVRTLNDVILNISDIMLGEMQLESVMKTPGIENIHILPSGRISYNPAELWGSKEIRHLVEELKKRFDFILFDSPPVLPIADATLLASKVDGVILVYESGRTARNALLRAKAQLDSAGAKILGVVLNCIKPEDEAMMSYPYYYKYKYRYYMESARKAHKGSAPAEGTEGMGT